jgi:hypothetical protein
MNPSRPGQPPTNTGAAPRPQGVEAQKHRADRLLYELAKDLRHLRVEQSTQALHVRALELKAHVSRWLEERPDARECEAVAEEILALHAEARERLANAGERTITLGDQRAGVTGPWPRRRAGGSILLRAHMRAAESE